MPLTGKVAKILTWRWKPEPNVESATDADAKKKKNRNRYRQREMFVKWHDMSYWHCEWVSELQVRNILLNGWELRYIRELREEMLCVHMCASMILKESKKEYLLKYEGCGTSSSVTSSLFPLT
mgnify:CR=1 FL=1